MTREHELFRELRLARIASRKAAIAVKEARAVLQQCEQTIEDIMSEIETGKALADGQPRPLLDAINEAKLNALQTACDETNNGVWTTEDLNQVLMAACFLGDPAPGEGGWWDIKRAGCDDRKILEILRAVWPMSGRFLPEPAPGCTIRGGATPSFWMGSKRPQDRIATLAGLELADRIRRVLEIPRAPEPKTEALTSPMTHHEPVITPRTPIRRSRRKETTHDAP